MRRTTPRGALTLVALAIVTLAGTLGATTAAARPWLGVYTQELTDDLRSGLDLQGGGVIVNQVVERGPADRAGVRKGDVIVRFNSREVDSPQALSDLVGGAHEGQTIALEVNRHGDSRTLSVTLGTRPSAGELPAPAPGMAPGAPQAPEAPEAPAPPDDHARREFRVRIDAPDDNGAPHEWSFDGDPQQLREKLRTVLPQLDRLDLPGLEGLGGRPRLGVRIESLNEDLASALDAPGHEGVLVLEVLKDTPAERAGLRAGDVILRVDDHAVADARALVSALRDAAGKVSIEVSRKGARRTVEAELDAAPGAGRDDGQVGQGRMEELRQRVRDRSDADRDDLKQQLDELRQQVEELRHQLEERNH